MQITEIFYSIQGEGTRRGRPCAFVRLTGCHLRCRWCDTEFSFHGGSKMESEEIIGKIEPFPTRMVCITGGEPLLQKSVHPLMSQLCDQGWTVLLETSGGVDASTVDERVIRILDVKAPGSGEFEKNVWSNLESIRPSDELKFVLADRADYEWAREFIVEHDLAKQCAALLISPVHGELEPSRLAAWMLDDGLPATLQFQEHKLLWPDAERGV